MTPDRGWRPFTVPNLISVVRLVCLPLFVWLVFGADDRWAAALLLGALGATDWVDGWIARRFDQESELGKILDPTADRLLLLVAVVTMIVDGSLPLVVAVPALVREGAVALAALALGAAGARKLDVTWWGKTGTLLMMFAVPCFLAGASDIAAAGAFGAAAWVFAAVGLPVHYWSAIGYVPAARAALAQRAGAGPAGPA
ncbi:MAG TPA: CDP-diacylglycerol--glycerol-3-phosphate 3-phosphatidyltransferase [Acidimicrobiaceae bacterium]|nr:CDP-diacylglycerol--glycerol-3-phosphate 3-phosphatidyltransferase [Acidimicrobiaceae bacterium]HCB36789.1 CDP-diacylglycerol--glycerol-3-phosphate 3-phosphatidyltransferase [Acidimicrobiaceae bacterium]